jgi:hypothetical protein
MSMPVSRSRNSGRELDQEQALQHPPDAERRKDGDRQRRPPAHRIDAAQEHEHERYRRKEEAEDVEDGRIGGEARDDQQHLRPARAGPERDDRRAAVPCRAGDDREREAAHQEPGPERQEAAARRRERAGAEVAPGQGHEDAEREPEQAGPELGVVESGAWSRRSQHAATLLMLDEGLGRMAPAST